MRKGTKLNFFINGSDKIYKFCSYVSPGAIESSRLTQFWVENICLLVDFSESYFVSNRRKHCWTTQNRWRNIALHCLETKYLSLEKGFKDQSHDGDKKKFDWFGCVLSNGENLDGRDIHLESQSQECVVSSMFHFHLICKSI